MTQSLENKSILLVISGGIAAYKSLELIRLIRKAGGHVRCILTKGGEQFVTPLSVASLCEEQVYTDLWSLKDETEMGHIRLSHEADLIVIAPASADLLAKMANGYANDLASTTLLAADKPILIAPAMNHKMWDNPATQENIAKLQARGIQMTGPEEGDMACSEYGLGRMSEPEEIFEAIKNHPLSPRGEGWGEGGKKKPLKGVKALVTSGPTYEPIDPVRFIGNRSSGKQGHAIAGALAQAGAEVTLVSGPTPLNQQMTRGHFSTLPPGLNYVKLIEIETAQEMLETCEKTIANGEASDIAICAAAVGDWTPQQFESHKIKKRKNDDGLSIQLQENPDILRTISRHKNRPKLVIGFAAETQDLLDNAKEKLGSKGCDWILANDVATEKTFGADENHVYLVSATGTEEWPRASKMEIARKLAQKIVTELEPYDRDIIQAAE